MKSIVRVTLLSILWTHLFCAHAFSDTSIEKPSEDPPAKEKPNDSKEPKEEISSTQHSLQIEGETLNYTATAGTLLLKKKDGKPKASIFFIAYTKDGVDAISTRPITFSFNGGPGSSSVWLHLGLLGPKRVLMDDDGMSLAPPYKLVENEFSLLDETDLVFIDPVSTGYSRAAPGEDSKQFHGVHKDLKSVGDFIRLYTTRHQRWSSPKYLIGESYGTTRAAGLAEHLQDDLGIYLNGIMLVSSVLDFQTILFNSGNHLPYVLFLPSYTATAWYHQKLDDELQKDFSKTLREAEKFALEEYSLALLRGSSITKADYQETVQKLSRYTGLSSTYIEQNNLKVNFFRFSKELQRDQRRTTGRFDSRFEGIDRDAAGEYFEYDPSYAAIQGPITATLNDYLRTELNFETDLNYEILSKNVHPWSYEKFQNRYLNFTDNLRQSIAKNPNLKVFVASGYYDLATPYFATDYTVNQIELEPSLRENIQVQYYEAGHMMYFHKPSLIKLKSDLQNFIQSSLPSP